MGRVIENAPNRWELLIPDFVELYNKPWIRVREISRRLDLTQNEYRHLLKYSVEHGLVVKRSAKMPKKKVRRESVKNYTCTPGGYCHVYYKREHYCGVRGEANAREIVRRLRECDWDKSQVARIKREVCSE